MNNSGSQFQGSRLERNERGMATNNGQQTMDNKQLTVNREP